ncbi:alpha/beta-hydrolase [Annulohypoxylon moriforme]|nr:alpha/beta-hydrolase [Annulohypoxylon moriforme]
MDFTVVICYGAWPLMPFFEPLIKSFSSKGHIAICNIPATYPAYDPSNPPKINPDTDHLRNHVLEPLLEEGKDIVIFMHSYGGAYGPEALKGCSKMEREKKGLTGGIVASIFTAAFVVPEGATPMGAMGLDPNDFPEWIDYDKSAGLVGFKKEHAKTMVFHDLPEEQGETLASMLPKQPYACFSTPARWDPFNDPSFQGTFGYIFTEADRIIPLEAQRKYVETARIDKTYLFKDSSHSPHIERPDELVDVVLDLVKDIISKT